MSDWAASSASDRMPGQQSCACSCWYRRRAGWGWARRLLEACIAYARETGYGTLVAVDP